MCHVDLYRTQAGEFKDLQEYLDRDDVLTVIEWPEKIKKLPQDRVEILFKITGANSRTAFVNPCGQAKQE